MNFLTPIPKELWLLVYVLWCLGSSNIATQLSTRWFKTVNSIVIQCLVKGAICCGGLIFFNVAILFSAPLWLQVLSIPIGFIFGYLVVKIEIILNRKQIRKSNKKNDLLSPAYRSFHGPTKKIMSLSPKWVTSKSQLKNMHHFYAANETKQLKNSLCLIISVAVFEEILFRGFVYQSCLLLNSIYTTVGLVISVIVFGISHASFGLHQIISKTILGFICLWAVIFCHTLVPAIIIHGYLNWKACQAWKL